MLSINQLNNNKIDKYNTKIYVFNDTSIEVVYYYPGWEVIKKPTVKKSAHGESCDYERNRKKTIRSAKSRIRRLIKQYNLRYLLTLLVGGESLTIKEADKKVQNFRKKLKAKYPSFNTWITTRFYEINDQLCYKIITNVFISSVVLQEKWEYGPVFTEYCQGSEDEIASNFTADFNDKRFRFHKLYWPAHGMDLTYQEFYFINEDEIESHVIESYPNLRKQNEEKYDGGLLKVFFYK